MQKKSIYTAFQKFQKMIRMESREISQLYIYALFSGVLSLVLPVGIQSIINFIQTGRTSTSWLIIIVIVVISIALNGFMQLMQLRITENLQQKIFVWSSLELSYRFRFIDQQKLGLNYPPELANRFFDTLVIQKGLSKVLIDIPTSVLQILFGVILLSLYHPFFIAFSFVLIVLLLLILYFSSRNAFETSMLESKSKYKTAHWIQEIARASTAFEAIGTNEFVLNKTDKYATGYIKARESHFIILWKQFSYLVLFKIIIALSLLVIGGLLVINQQMTIGQFIASEIIILLVISSVEKLILSLSTFYDVLTSTEKISEIADYPLKDDVPTSLLSEFIPNDTVFTFKDVSFTSPYDQKRVLKNVTCDINPGIRLAVVSNAQLCSETFVKLLQNHFSPTSGNVLLNGINISHFNLNEVKRNIGSFMESDTIFYGTILDNIKMGREEISMDCLSDVLRQLNLLDFINSFSQGLDTYLLSGGNFLPPEIKQKIILARALVGQPSMIVMDASWQLLYEMDSSSFQFMFTQTNPLISCISCVTDRSLLDLFEQVAVIDSGELIAFGSRKEVLKNITIETYCHV
jgi:ABC-type bacteriocin/lantibiotic exporter with double-glycine peptidase domain